MKRLLMALVTLTLLAAPLAAQSTVFERAVREAEVARQRTLARIRQELDAVEGSLAGGRYTEASLHIQTAQRLLRLGDEIVPEDKMTLGAEIDRVAALVSDQRAAAIARGQAKAQVEITEQEARRLKDAKLSEKRQLESHWAQLEQFRERGQYEKAVVQADQVLRKRPGDNRALMTKWDMEYLASLSAQLKLRGVRRGETQRVLVDTEEAAVPYHKMVVYPDARKWEEMSARRLTNLARQMGYQTDTSPSRALLQKRIDLKVSDIGLPSVLTYLSEASGVPIILDPHIETDTGEVPADQVVTFDGKQLTVQQILDMVLPKAYAWRISEGQVIVCSPEKANPTKTITYPIQHLVASIPDFGDTVPRMDLGGALNQGGDSGGGSNELFPTTDEATDDEPSEQKIIDLITRFVKGTRVEPWEDDGGTASIMYYNGTLIISQTDEGHRKVVELLGRL